MRKDKIKLEGKYKVELVRKGKVVAVREGKNLITDEGKDALLDIMFNAVTQVTAWFIGLVDNAAFTAFAAGDTMASHAGWAEAEGYSDGTRPAWGVDDAASQSISNSTAASFTIDEAATIKGIFVSSDDTIGGSTGTLWNGVAFTAALAVEIGDTLKVTYSVSA